MRTFVLRARAAPTDSQKLLAGVGQEAHTEILAHTLMNAMFVAQSHRAGVVAYLVLESTQDYSRTLAESSTRFEQPWPAIEAQGFDQRFLRLWRFYLAYCQAGFNSGCTDVMQFELVHRS